MVATDGTWREAEADGDSWRSTVGPALTASVVLLLVVAVFLVARRLAGALDTQLAPAPLFVTAASLLVWACAIRLRLRDRRADWSAAVVVALFAVACSFPGERMIDWLVWLSAFAAYGLLPARRTISAAAVTSIPDRVVQQLTRTRSTDGREAIHGTLVADFAPGERTAMVHVAFCPPFERLPQVEAKTVDGHDCILKIAQVLHQGARIDVRLGRVVDSARRVSVEIVARDHPPLAV